ncbi:MAG: DNA repair protein RecO [Anaerolineae bacterium]|nr:DNA repair protein RecO [Anaerolineae bacterium]
MTSRLYTLEGIVLMRRDHSEADRVVTLLTAEGRFSLLAKGVRKLRSRKAGHLELFTRTRLLVSRVEGSWDIISQAEAQVTRSRLQEDFERATCARYVAELALRLFEDDTGDALYALVDDVLSRLAAGPESNILLRWYEQQVLTLAGFRPDWDACVGERDGRQCERLLAPRPDNAHPYGVDPERGGALCQDCWAVFQETAFAPPSQQVASPMARPLSPSTLSWLQALQRRSYADVVQFPLAERTAQELAQVMERYIAYHLERRPATLRMMK